MMTELEGSSQDFKVTMINALYRRIKSASTDSKHEITNNNSSAFLAREISDYLSILILVLVGAYIFYTGLGAYPIRNWDEAIYANAARNVLDGYFLVPHVDWMYGPNPGFQAFLEKPPLVIWLQAGAMLLFGTTEFAARFPSATASILTGILIYVIGREFFDRLAGFLGAVIFYTTPMVYVGFDAGRTGGLDMTLIFLGSFFVYLTYRISIGESDRYGLLGVLAGLAVLAKGFAAGPFLIAVIPIVYIRRGRFLRIRFARTIAATMVVVVPWSLYTWFKFKDRFIGDMIYDQIFARAAGQFAVSGGIFEFQNFPYVRNQFIAFDPWIYLLIPILSFIIIITINNKSSNWKYMFLIWWAVAVFGSYLPTGNHAWYMLPMYVPLGVLLGSFLSDAIQGRRNAVIATIFGLFLPLFFSIRMGSMGPQIIREFVFEYGFAGPYVTGFSYAFGIGFGILLVLLGSRHQGGNEWIRDLSIQKSHIVIVIICISIFVFSMVQIPPDTAQYDEGWSADQKELGIEIRTTVPSDETIYYTHEAVTSANADDALHSLPFYTDHTFTAVSFETVSEDKSIQYVLIDVFQFYMLEDLYHPRVEQSRISVRDKTIVFMNRTN